MAISKISANMIDGSLTSSLVIGSLPAVDGSALVGAGAGIDTETTSDPTVSSNPSGTGHLWVNKNFWCNVHLYRRYCWRQCLGKCW